MTLLRTIAFGALGAAVGSFLNVVIHRVPLGDSIVKPASRCPACKTDIGPCDNVPVLSWLLLKGRCRSCGATISVRYPLVEALAAVLCIACSLRFSSVEEAFFAAAALSVLLALTFIDLEHRRLPNSIVLPSIVVAIAWVGIASALSGDLDVIATAAACGAAAFALFFVIALVSGGMGFGDVKLSAFIGVVAGRFGWELAVAAIMASFFIGGFVAIALLVFRHAGRKQAVPFGPAMAAGATVALFAGTAPVRAWLGI